MRHSLRPLQRSPSPESAKSAKRWRAGGWSGRDDSAHRCGASSPARMKPGPARPGLESRGHHLPYRDDIRYNWFVEPLLGCPFASPKVEGPVSRPVRKSSPPARGAGLPGRRPRGRPARPRRSPLPGRISAEGIPAQAPRAFRSGIEGHARPPGVGRKAAWRPSPGRSSGLPRLPQACRTAAGDAHSPPAGPTLRAVGEGHGHGDPPQGGPCRRGAFPGSLSGAHRGSRLRAGPGIRPGAEITTRAKQPECGGAQAQLKSSEALNAHRP